MTKRKLVQLAIVVCLVLALGIGGYFGWRKFAIKADVLATPLNLTATLPGVADDVIYDHWAFKYIDAVTKKVAEPKNDPRINKLMNFYFKYVDGEVSSWDFRPAEQLNRVQLATTASRIAYIQGKVSNPNPKCTQQIFEDVPTDSGECGYINLAHHIGWVSKGNCPQTGSKPNFCPLDLATIKEFKDVLTKAGYPINNPPGVSFNDGSWATRDIIAGLLAYNMG